MTDAIRIHSLSYHYDSRKVLSDLSLTIEKGEIFGILGPNGGGKTTLFRILSTLIPVQAGSIEVDSVDLRTYPAKVRGLLGVVFQNASLDKKLTVTENLWHQGHLYGLRGGDLKKRIEKNLSRLRLTERRNDLTGILSGGLQRRVEIAKGLLHDPKILLLDEPSTGLDPGVRRDLWNTLDELRKERGVTVVLTTHILEEAEGCDRVAILDHGKLVAVGTPAELKSGIRGDVISLEVTSPEEFSRRAKSKWSLPITVVDSEVRIEHPTAHRFISDLFEVFPSEIMSVRLRKPTLEDVFVHLTGNRFDA